MTHSNKEALSELHKRMHGCRLCLEAGYPIYPRAIFSGQEGARIMTIGQAPGVTEKDAGRPFNASSGTRLFRWLADAGIEEDWFRATQYMTSVTKCFPGSSKSGNGDRVPSRVEQDLCLPFLKAEIETVDPYLIIPIGKLAINLFYPRGAKLSEIIGSQIQVDGRWIVPFPHPSGASRWPQIPENKALIPKAIALVKSHVEMIFQTSINGHP